MLILNAGIFGHGYEETEDKIDKTMQVNHLSHMYLALLLEPLLKKKSRVVFVSSESHRYTFDNQIMHSLFTNFLLTTK